MNKQQREKVIDSNSYNENNWNSFIRFAEAIRHVMTIHMTNPRARDPLNAAATLPDLPQCQHTSHD